MGAPSVADGVDLSAHPESNDTKAAATAGRLDDTYTALIQQYLSMLCLDNAIFLAERYVAHHKSSESLYLLAMCHYRSGSPQSARAVLEQNDDTSRGHRGSIGKDANTLYLLAKCYYDLKQYGRAEDALLAACRNQYRARSDDKDGGTRSATNDNMEEWILSKTPCPLPNGAVGLHLLADICRNSNRKERAIKYYRMSLKLDPMMWSSYEALCELGAPDDVLDPVEIFGVCPDALVLPPEPLEDQKANLAQPTPREERGVLTPSFLSQTPITETAAAAAPSPARAAIDLTTTPMSSFLPKTSLFPTSSRHTNSKPPRPSGTSLFETPNLTPIPMTTEKSYLGASGDGFNPVVVRRANRVASRLYYPPSPETASPSSSNKPRSLFLGGLDSMSIHMSAASRKGGSFSRLSLSKDIIGEGASVEAMDEGTAPRGGLSMTGASRPGALFEKESSDSGAAERSSGCEIDEDSVKSILELLCIMGGAHKRLCQYRCREAIQIFHRLPQEQFRTGWVLHQVGRAHSEMADYRNAQRYLELMQQTEPHRIKGLEVLSTTLWQLKKEVQLSHLAQRATDFDRLSAESWCVVGNCFSLQKDHEAALTFFRRSIQLDPSFTYSHTLSGHEYMAIEDFEKAKACYRDAIRADDRHYNAWYGIGTIYFRQEQFELAEYHFQRAIDINPQSAVLLCHLGLAQNNNGKAYDALETFSRALKVSPRNPQARYQRANIYTALDRPREALAELEKVRDLCPREASVHYGMGKVLKRLGRTEQAMRCFLIALDLEPKDTNLSIKAAMEKMDEPDIPEEEISAY